MEYNTDTQALKFRLQLTLLLTLGSKPFPPESYVQQLLAHRIQTRTV